jgi:hypothetical protein
MSIKAKGYLTLAAIVTFITLVGVVAGQPVDPVGGGAYAYLAPVAAHAHAVAHAAAGHGHHVHALRLHYGLYHLRPRLFRGGVGWRLRRALFG